MSEDILFKEIMGEICWGACVSETGTKFDIEGFAEGLMEILDKYSIKEKRK